MAKSQRRRVQEWIALLSDPSKWTKHRNAEDANGQSVHERSKTAVRWCAVGGALRLGVSQEIMRMVRENLKVCSITLVNDGRDGRRKVLKAVTETAKELDYIASE